MDEQKMPQSATQTVLETILCEPILNKARCKYNELCLAQTAVKQASKGLTWSWVKVIVSSLPYWLREPINVKVVKLSFIEPARGEKCAQIAQADDDDGPSSLLGPWGQKRVLPIPPLDIQ